MRKLNLSQLALAGRAGVSQTYINLILRSGRLPDDARVHVFARVFGESASEGLAALYLDRVGGYITRLLATAPASTRRVLRALLKDLKEI